MIRDETGLPKGINETRYGDKRVWPVSHREVGVNDPSCLLNHYPFLSPGYHLRKTC